MKPRYRFGVICGWLVGSWAAAAGLAGEWSNENWPVQRGSAAGEAAISCPKIDAPFQDWAFQGRPKQAYERGVPVWASPVAAVVNGHPLVFIGGADQTLYALDVLARRRVWSKVTNGFIGDAPVVAQVQGRAVVFWGSSDRYVYAHAAQDGAPLWSRELVAPTSTQTQARIPAPFFDQGVLYAACFFYDKAFIQNRQEAWLFALDASTGQVLWRQELAHGPVNAPVGCRLDGELYLYVAARKGILQAFRVSRQGPRPAWSYQMPHEVLGSPAVWAGTGADPLLFLGSKFGDLVALAARTGQRRWHHMTGHWIDNNPCCGLVKGTPTVFVGSNDYSLYALRAGDGQELWPCRLGAEIYSAPCLFTCRNQAYVAAASLDDHLYVVDAVRGIVESSFYTGEPTWDKIAKGETLWGSPLAVCTGNHAALVHGSYDGAVYVLPLFGESRFRAKTQSQGEIWFSLSAVGLLFAGVVLPLVLRWRSKTESAGST